MVTPYYFKPEWHEIDMKITGKENNKLILEELGRRIRDIRIGRSITQ